MCCYLLCVSYGSPCWLRFSETMDVCVIYLLGSWLQEGVMVELCSILEAKTSKRVLVWTLLETGMCVLHIHMCSRMCVWIYLYIIWKIVYRANLLLIKKMVSVALCSCVVHVSVRERERLIMVRDWVIDNGEWERERSQMRCTSAVSSSMSLVQPGIQRWWVLLAVWVVCTWDAWSTTLCPSGHPTPWRPAGWTRESLQHPACTWQCLHPSSRTETTSSFA